VIRSHGQNHSRFIQSKRARSSSSNLWVIESLTGGIQLRNRDDVQTSGVLRTLLERIEVAPTEESVRVLRECALGWESAE